MSLSDLQHQSDLAALKALLPAPPLPIGSYVAVTRVDRLLYTSGVLPMKDGQVAYTGAIGTAGADAEHGRAAARLCILNARSLAGARFGDAP